MSKFSGYIGYAVQEEVEPGIWVDKIVERKVRGNLLGDVNRRNAQSEVNDKITITNRLSILAGRDVYNNMQDIVYVKFNGTAWRVSSIENQRPRLLIYFGGVWNGDQPSEATEET